MERLVREYAGTGTIKIKTGKEWNLTEEIVIGHKDSVQYYIGTAVDNRTGKKGYTRCFKIHYSKKGIHIVPSYNSKAKMKS